MVTVLLVILCENGYSNVAWLIVFIPFILMTIIVGILLYVFGFDITTNNIKTNKNNPKCETNCSDDIKINNKGDILIYDPYYNPIKDPVYYMHPNVVVPNPHNNNNISSSQPQIYPQTIDIPTNYSSDPSYKS